MTTATAAPSATQAVTDFFDAYRRHDTLAMVDLCTEDADFSYVPFEMWGKQRVLRGDGKVCTIGRPIWEGLIAAFPDLSNEVHSITTSESGDVAVVVSIGGTQSGDWGPATANGQKYWEPHVFLFDVTDDGRIDRITAYWDNGSISRQLGHFEVD